MVENIKVYWKNDVCIAEIPGIETGKGDCAYRALDNLYRSFIAKCKDRCHTCLSSNVTIVHEDRIGKYVNTLITIVACRDCNTTRVDNLYVENKRRDFNE